MYDLTQPIPRVTVVEPTVLVADDGTVRAPKNYREITNLHLQLMTQLAAVRSGRAAIAQAATMRRSAR